MKEWIKSNPVAFNLLALRSALKKNGSINWWKKIAKSSKKPRKKINSTWTIELSIN